MMESSPHSQPDSDLTTPVTLNRIPYLLRYSEWQCFPNHLGLPTVVIDGVEFTASLAAYQEHAGQQPTQCPLITTQQPGSFPAQKTRHSSYIYPPVDVHTFMTQGVYQYDQQWRFHLAKLGYELYLTEKGNLAALWDHTLYHFFISGENKNILKIYGFFRIHCFEELRQSLGVQWDIENNCPT